MSSAWKVAYADFVTALMAFFLLMWVINMVPPETKQGLASYFQEEALLETSSSSTVSNSAVINRTDKLDLSRASTNETEKSANLAIMRKLKARLTADAVPMSASGLSADDVGVLLRISNNAMFSSGSAELTPEGRAIVDSVRAIMQEYNVYLVIRGHADSSEVSGTLYPSPWELSAARAAAAARLLQEEGVTPTKIRAVAYGDTRPLEPGATENILARNRRVEFYFHRPEALTYSITY